MAKQVALTNRQRLDSLLKRERPEKQPRISIYLPTHRTQPQNEQDSIVYKNLVNEAKNQLETKYPKKDWSDTISRLQLLTSEAIFWQHSLDGLAVLASGDDLEIFRLLYAPKAEAVVANTFHIVSLLGYVEHFDEAYMAEIGRNKARLYLVNRYGHEPYLPESIVTDFSDLFDDFDDDASLNFGSYGGRSGMYHGHRSASEEQDKDRDKYFRYLDEAFMELYRKEKKPILLAGAKSSLTHFRQIAKGSGYLNDAIEQPVDSLSSSELQKQIASAMDPLFRKYLGGISSRLRKAKSQNKVQFKFEEIKKSVEIGNVGELLIDLSRATTPDKALDKLIMDAMKMGAQLTVLTEKIDELRFPVTAILRG